ncbi:conjugal transfer protein MobA [uncultured Draconibacterium sp.]|uniref:conjugal transfer protein MobA n=1 Tax=uncultured Draconibacterium sp. TaxID=1573823 RepID=UPI0025EA7F15|nr:conjugal transfer protein MobA [uncultured Draconibacterium sp.]
METERRKNKHKGGRKPKKDPCRHRYAISLNDVDNARFLALFEASGMEVKAHFITACIFDKPVKVVKIDKGSMDYYMRLTSFYSQFRAIGVNYNQVTKAIKNNFSEKKALAFLAQLQKATFQLVAINQKILELTKEFEERWLQK